jgi:hypothetical protein
MTPEEVIKNHLEPLQDVLTTWIESPYVAKRLSEPETVSATWVLLKASD